MSADKQNEERRPTDPGSAAYRFEFDVPEDVIDQNGHANNVAYVQWMQDAAVRHFLAAGGASAMAAAGGTWVVRSHKIEYLGPVYAGDRLQVCTWVVNYRRVRSLRRYDFIRSADGATVARGETEWVFVDAESRRPMAIPEEIKRRLAGPVPGP
jgi:acyl-CoA thioester hydrolase